MNVFVLDYNSQKSAEYHTDKHVVKMITESAQLLSSAYYATDSIEFAPYKLSHAQHPWAIWARKSIDDWYWLAIFGIYLYEEYKYRYYNRIHAGGEAIKGMLEHPPNIDHSSLKPMPLCMPDYCKTSDVVEAYRTYYIKEKSHLFRWTGRDVPFWIQGDN